MGEVLPPHLSPFIDEEKDQQYIPPEARALYNENELEEQHKNDENQDEEKDEESAEGAEDDDDEEDVEEKEDDEATASKVSIFNCTNQILT